MQIKQVIEDTGGVDKAQTADEPQRTENTNKVDDLGIDNRQATEDADGASHRRRKWSGQGTNSRQATEDGRHRQSGRLRYRHRHSRHVTGNRNGVDKAQIADESQKT